jgi:hypothetical protein
MMMMMMISPFGQLGLWAPSSGTIMILIIVGNKMFYTK